MEGCHHKTLAVVATVVSIIALGGFGVSLVGSGLSLRITDLDGQLVRAYPRAELDTFRVDALVALRPRLLRAQWDGYWIVPEPGLSTLILKADGRASVWIDGEIAIETADPDRATRLERRVGPGLHRLSVAYQTSSNEHDFVFRGLTPTGISVRAARGRLFLEPPSLARRIAPTVSRIALVLAAAVWFAWLVPFTRGRARDRLTTWAPVALAVAAALLAGALRFEALVTVYWGVAGPPWAVTVADHVRDLRPGAFEHVPTNRPYEGDPFSYLAIARTMSSFYGPSSREPLFPALTRTALFLADGRDIGINFLSALASTLVCLAVFALGRALSRPWAGAIAAVLWAIEWQSIELSVQGWRDDLFTLQVTMCTAALIAIFSRPDRRSTMTLGVLAGLTLLTRLTAFSFLVPGLLCVVLMPGLAPRRHRAWASLGAFVLMLAIAGPFMVACAQAFGDPFYSVNVHAAFYRSRAGLAGSGASTVTQLFTQLLGPWEFARTGFAGLTTVPFDNKWFGLGALFPGLGEIGRWLALAGLPVLLWRSGGLIVLVALFSSIAPYAWTWNIPGGAEWRFTLPAYPFYLLSSGLTLEALGRGLRTLSSAASRPAAIRSAMRVAATFALGALLFVQLGRSLDWRRVEEAAFQGRTALIPSDRSSVVFFRSGWTRSSPPAGAPFVLTGSEGIVRLPVARRRELRLTLRPGAAEGGTVVEVSLDDRLLTRLSGPRGPGETIVLELAADVIGDRDSIDLRFAPAPAGDRPFSLLWLRIEANGSPPA